MLIGFGIVISLVAAARSTWSPCGLSMLSQITPLAEAGRGHKFARTASWFVLGAVLGGLTLGTGIAAAAWVVRAAGISRGAALVSVACAALVSAAVDMGVFGFGPPFVRRQVDDAWLSQYRSWVYGTGFGWQIGVGVTTYVMTTAVPLMILLGALSAKPWGAAGLGTLFGFARGLAVLAGARLRTPAALLAFHRRFDSWAAPARETVILAELAVAVTAMWEVAPPEAAVLTTAVAAAFFAWAHARISRPTSGAFAFDPLPAGSRSVARSRAYVANGDAQRPASSS